MELSRRTTLKGLAAIAGTGAVSLSGSSGLAYAAAATTRKTPARSRLEGLPSLDEIWEWETFMNGLGTRWTGSRAHARFVEFLTDEFRRTGCSIDRLHYTFPFWEEHKSAIAIGEGRHRANVPVSGHMRCSNQNATAPYDVAATKVTAPLYYGGTYPNLNLDPSTVAGKILYIDHPLVPEAYTAPAPGALFETMATYPAGTPFPPPGFQPPPQPLPAGTTDNAAYGSFNFAGFTLPAGCVGFIAGWQNISEGNARYQDSGISRAGVPGLFVGPSAGNTMRQAAMAGRTATMTLEATVTPNTPTDTIFATLPGSSEEIVIVNTHSDGPNFTEENGSLGILALARHLSRIPRSRRHYTYVFVIVTGHLTPPYYEPWENAGFIASNPGIIADAVAGLTVEHLGAMEWCDDADLRYRPTGLVETAICPVNPLPGKTTSAVAGVLLDSLKRSRDARVALTKGVFLGLGGAFYAAGIPQIGHIPVPNYLLAAPPDGYIGKFNPRHMYAQIELFADVLHTIDGMTAAQLQGA